MQRKGAALRAVQVEDSNLQVEGAPPPPSAASLPEKSGRGSEEGSPPVVLSFTPVPRRYRHDGWTPERQRAFIEALADTGCVDRAARMVNIAQTNCYTLRRAPGAEEFRRAWDAALDFGLKRLKDIAFERAIEGELIPVFAGGRLMGFRRKRNDALLMFCLRHYGQDGQGRRTTINYFSSRASAGASAGAAAGVSDRPHPNPSPQGEGLAVAAAQASATTVRTVITGPGGAAEAGGTLDRAAAALNGFDGVALDAEAEAAIEAALQACAARARAADAAYKQGGEAAVDAAEDDPDESFVPVGEQGDPYRGELLPPVGIEDFVPFTPGEPHWTLAGADKPAELVRIEDMEATRAAARKGGKGAGVVKGG